jgi:hypothetical protein
VAESGNAAASRAVDPLGRQGSNPCPGAIRTFNDIAVQYLVGRRSSAGRAIAS